MKYVAPDRSPIPPKQSARCFATFAESKIRYQQPQACIVSDTLLANDGCGIGFGTGVVVGTAELDALDPFCHRSRRRSMLLAHHFAYPLAIGTFVGPGVKDEGVAAGELPSRSIRTPPTSTSTPSMKQRPTNRVRF